MQGTQSVHAIKQPALEKEEVYTPVFTTPFCRPPTHPLQT